MPARPEPTVGADVRLLTTELRVELFDLGSEVSTALSELGQGVRGEVRELKGEVAELRAEVRTETVRVQAQLHRSAAVARAEARHGAAATIRYLRPWLDAFLPWRW